MSLNFRFAVVSDLHIALPHDLESSQSVSLGGVSIPALEIVLGI